ncbi:MAG TPA: hypothetical protein VN622_17675 [Clostridia bacterium]|nr:hypothetical protein [Clostridia bacterium]
MSEQNILNPTPSDPLNPDYGWNESPLGSFAEWQAASGEYFSRTIASRGLTRDVSWSNQLQSTADKLRQWWAQYRNGFFTLADYDRGRYYSVRFVGKLDFTPAGFDKVNIKGQVVELPNVPMYQYPTNWARDAVFIEERDDYGNDLVVLVGGWSWFPSAGDRHGTGLYQSNLADRTAEWQYFGYGFRVWQIKHPSCGINEVSLDGVVLGTFDGYGAAANSSPLFTRANVALGIHRVKIRITGTKNAASTGFIAEADAIEVMQ